MLMTIVCFGINVNAQTASCKVGNGTIVASVDGVDDNGNVTVSFSSTAEKSVNVTFTVVYYIQNSSSGGSKVSNVLVRPDDSTPKIVNIGKGNKVARLTIKCQ